MPGGALGSARSTPQNGTNAEANMPATSARTGINFHGLNICPCDAASDAVHQTPTGCTYDPGAVAPFTGLAPSYNGGVSCWDYISGLLNAVAAGVILFYVMNGVLNYLPSLIDGLVAQGTGTAQMLRSAVPGQGMIRSAMDSASASAIGATKSLDTTIRNKVSALSGNRVGGE